MLKLAFTLASVALIVSSPAMARDRIKSSVPALSATVSSAVVASGPAVAAVSDRQRYCVVDTPTGSHIVNRVCKTRTEWLASDDFDPAAKK